MQAGSNSNDSGLCLANAKFKSSLGHHTYAYTHIFYLIDPENLVALDMKFVI
jgi:hypothetical protein